MFLVFIPVCDLLFYSKTIHKNSNIVIIHITHINQSRFIQRDENKSIKHMSKYIWKRVRIFINSVMDKQNGIVIFPLTKTHQFYVNIKNEPTLSSMNVHTIIGSRLFNSNNNVENMKNLSPTVGSRGKTVAVYRYNPLRRDSCR